MSSESTVSSRRILSRSRNEEDSSATGNRHNTSHHRNATKPETAKVIINNPSPTVHKNESQEHGNTNLVIFFCSRIHRVRKNIIFYMWSLFFI